MGGALSGLVAGAFHFVLDQATWVAALGIPVGAILGYLSAPRVVSTDRPLAAGIVLAAIAPGLGWALVAGSLLVAGTVSTLTGSAQAGEQVIGALVIAAASLVPSFMIGLPLTIPVGLVAVVLFRRLARLPSGARFAVAASICAAAIGLGGLAVIDTRVRGSRESAHVGAYQEDHPLDLALAPVRLNWIVTNHRHQDLMMSIEQPSGDGWSGWGIPVPACATSGGRLAIGHGWRLERPIVEDVDEIDPFHDTPLVREADPVARDVTISIDLAPDGTTTIEWSGSLPTEAELDTPLC